MPITLVATASAVGANTYADLVTAQAILDVTPNSTAWGTDATAQAVALVAATRMLDVVAWRGVRATVGQALQWPRLDVIDPDYGQDAAGYGYKTNAGWAVYLDYTILPTRIVRGCVALALEILRAGPADVWGVDAQANVLRKTVDVLSTEYAPIAQRRFGLRVYPSVWREIAPLTLASDQPRVSRA